MERGRNSTARRWSFQRYCHCYLTAAIKGHPIPGGYYRLFPGRRRAAEKSKKDFSTAACFPSTGGCVPVFQVPVRRPGTHTWVALKLQSAECDCGNVTAARCRHTVREHTGVCWIPEKHTHSYSLRYAHAHLPPDLSLKCTGSRVWWEKRCCQVSAAAKHVVAFVIQASESLHRLPLLPSLELQLACWGRNGARTRKV